MLLNKSFKTSVNIKFDIGDVEFIQRYLPTPSHAESLIGLSDGFINTNSNAAHIMIGPYGSGKSLVATILANFVTKAVNEEELEILLKKFNKVHEQVYNSLNNLNKLQRKFVTVTLSGSEGVFSDTIISSIVDELHSQGIEIHLPQVKDDINNTINIWFKKYPDTYERFINVLSDRDLTIESWTQSINSNTLSEIDWFKSVYPNLTAGAVFSTHNGGFFIEKINYILNRLEELNLGVFIIYDEFGRFLQSLDHKDIYKTMQDIQDLAEVSNRSKGLLQLLLISHKSMSQYMFGFNADYQSEFQRIEKRFSTYFIESDSATYYRIAEQYTNEITNTSSKKLLDFSNTIMNLRKFGLFQELNQQELEKIIVEGLYPVHPITMYLLPRVSKVFGQNERTLFTFLESEETGGLRNHIKKDSQDYYFPHSLFDFFFSQNLVQYQHDEAYQSLRIYRGIEKKLAMNKKTIKHYQIIKLITLWEITYSNSTYGMNSELISFATGMDIEEIEEILKDLGMKKLIRFNRILNHWELMLGSPIIIDEAIKEELKNQRVTSEERIALLNRNLKRKYFLATEYNEEKNITRYMQVKLISSKQFLREIVNEESLLEKNADGFVCFIVLESKSDYNSVKEKIKSLESSFLIFAVLTEDFKTIQKYIDHKIALDVILTDKKLLSENENLEGELILSREELIHDIKAYLNLFFEFRTNVHWFHEGENINLSSELDLEDEITEIMRSKFAKTPVIMNDSINRHNVIGIQRASLFKVADNVLRNFDQENIGIEGQGPDYLIYATVIKNNNIELTDLDKLSNPYFSEVRRLLTDQIIEHPKGNLEDLSKILSKPPFGIRKPLIPLFIMILLRDKWDQLIFYRNKMFVPSLESEKIYEMFNEPNAYHYEFHNYSPELIRMMEFIETTVQKYISEYVIERTPLIRVSSGLLNWLRQLPRFTQTTHKVTGKLVKLKEIIRQSEINPLASLEKLERLYSKDIQELQKDMKKLEKVYANLIKKVTSFVEETLNIKSFEDKEKFYSEFDAKTIVNNRLLLSLTEVKDIEEFGLKYIGTELTNWSDTTYELFLSQIRNDLQALSNTDSVHGDIIELAYNNKFRQIKKVELSTKSQIIYTNVDRMIKNAGRSVPRAEIDYIIYKLIDEYID